MRSIAWTIVAASAVGLCGCATGNLLKFHKEVDPFATAEDPVNKVLAIWDEGRAFVDNRKTTRGFVGTVMFFNSKSQGPVRVKGNLRVFVFENQGAPTLRGIPIHEFTMPAETLNAHYNHTDVGAAYVIFVPYPKGGSHRASCSLRVQFIPIDETTSKPNSRAAVFSDMAEATLLGPDGKDEPGTDSKIGDLAAAGKPKEAERKPTTSEDVLKPARAPAMPLTDAERERIIAEAMSRNGQKPSEPRILPAAAVQSASKHPLEMEESSDSDKDQPSTSKDPWENPFDKHEESRSPKAANPDPFAPVTGHPLEEQGEEEEPEEPVLATPVSRLKPPVRAEEPAPTTDSVLRDNASEPSPVPKDNLKPTDTPLIQPIATTEESAELKPTPVFPRRLSQEPVEPQSGLEPTPVTAPSTAGVPTPALEPTPAIEPTPAVPVPGSPVALKSTDSAAVERQTAMPSGDSRNWLATVQQLLGSRPILWCALVLVVGWKLVPAALRRSRTVLARAARWAVTRTLAGLNLQVVPTDSTSRRV